MAQLITIKGTPVTAANEVLVADSNSKIPAVDGSLVTTMAGGNIAGTIPTARLDTGTTANKLVVITGSGLPAVDGSLLTGIVSHTTSASDPTISTNPATGVGAEWINSTSGKQFICTDATAGANVWTCSGSGSGDIVPWAFGGTNYGFVHGNHPGSNAVDRWSFASDGNATDWGNTVGTGRYSKGGNSDKDNGYSYNCGGYNPPINEIIRFSMTTASTSNDVGDLTQTGQNYASMGNATHGWVAGSSIGDTTRVEKMAFASSGNATDWSDLLAGTYDGGGATNGTGTYGYSMGGWSGAPYTNMIQKINLTAQATSTDVANLSVARQANAGNSSSTHGYCTGGWASGGASNVTDKFNMSTDADATDVGNATLSLHERAGSSSTTYGYVVGGSGSSNVIDKFPFASDANATDVGDLFMSDYAVGSGTQY